MSIRTKIANALRITANYIEGPLIHSGGIVYRDMRSYQDALDSKPTLPKLKLPSGGGSGRRDPIEVNVHNLGGKYDEFTDYLFTAAGQKAIMNVIKKNRSKFELR